MKPPRVFRRASALRRALGSGPGTLGFVPTMGALHEGHLSLVRRARRENARVVVSIFVNPTQFGPQEDFASYPRTLGDDLRLLAPLGPLFVYAPTTDDVYPIGFNTTVKVGGALGSRLDAARRPGHFDGVATVVARLFALVGPDRAYFGLKDYQQFLVVRRMCADLGLGVSLRGCPIVRESDGLAMSSRNVYLGAEARMRAPALLRSLRAAADLAARGERSVSRLRRAGLEVLARVHGLKVQYFELADPTTLEPLRRLEGPVQVLTACVLARTRLIDNLVIHPVGLPDETAKGGVNWNA